MNMYTEAQVQEFLSATLLGCVLTSQDEKSIAVHGVSIELVDDSFVQVYIHTNGEKHPYCAVPLHGPAIRKQFYTQEVYTIEDILAVKSHLPTPKTVVLCGSSRFSQAFQQANLQETLAGHIVLTIRCDTKSDDALRMGVVDKLALDVLHFCKIDRADEVYVLNVDGYIGTSTAREIAYARQQGKPIRWLVESPQDRG